MGKGEKIPKEKTGAKAEDSTAAAVCGKGASGGSELGDPSPNPCLWAKGP